MAQSAATVKVAPVKDRTIKPGARATVKPRLIVRGKVKVQSRKVTATRNGKVVATGKRQVRLRAGTYRLKTRVVYRERGATSPRKVAKRTQRLVIRHQRAAAPKPKSAPPRACTRTSTGKCIAGGQFCPKAKYGQLGWDAQGRAYRCTGDRNGPRWIRA